MWTRRIKKRINGIARFECYDSQRNGISNGTANIGASYVSFSSPCLYHQHQRGDEVFVTS